MERDSRAEQYVVAALKLDEIFGKNRQPTLVCPLERLDVAQATVTKFEIRFEAIRHVACIVLAFAHPGTQRGEECAALLVPDGPALGRYFVGELAVAGEESTREQRRCGVEICSDDCQLFLDGADCVTELDACIPQRVPERTRHCLDGGCGLLAFKVVDE